MSELDDKVRAAKSEALVPLSRLTFRAVVRFVGPACSLLFAVEAVLARCWQSYLLVACALLMWAAFAVARALAERGQIQRAIALTAFFGWVTSSLTIFLRADALGASAMGFLTATIGGWLFWPILLRWGIGLSMVSVFVSESLASLSFLPRITVLPVAQTIFQIGLAVVLLPFMAVLLWAGKRANEEPFLKLEKRAEEQRTILGLVSRTQPDIEDLASRVERLSDALAEQASEQLATIEGVASSAEQLEVMILEAGETAQFTRRIAENTRASSIRHWERLEAVENEFSRFFSLLSNVGGAIQRLSQQSGRTEEILDYVRDVDEQMNMLALNAALEASHAGEAGKEFGVVASELGDMISGTAENVKRGTEILERIRMEGVQTVKDLETSAGQLRKYIDELGMVGSLIRQIIDSFGETAKKIDIIAMAADLLQGQVVQVAGAMRSLHDAARRVSALAQDLAASTQRIVNSHASLKSLVQAHGTEDGGSSAPVAV